MSALLLKSEGIAQIVAFLASDRATSIGGALLTVDGRLMAKSCAL